MCWRAPVNILGGRSCVRWISCECHGGVRGTVADVWRTELKRREEEGERKDEEEENVYFRHFRNLRREVSRGTVHEVVAHELRSR